MEPLNPRRALSLRERVWILIGFLLALSALIYSLVPRLAVPYTTGNETAAIATLRNLALREAEFQASKRVDVDGDGIGEHGFLEEMTATAGVRADPRGETRSAIHQWPILSPALTPAAGRDAGAPVTKSGYCFRVFLPSGASSAATETAPGKPFSAPVDTELAEKHWCAYAWPMEHGQTGNRAFFVNEAGDVWQCANGTRKYQGVIGGPAWNAALPPGSAWGASPRPDAPASDGETWIPVQ